jgi:hypothetical protein
MGIFSWQLNENLFRKEEGRYRMDRSARDGHRKNAAGRNGKG